MSTIADCRSECFLIICCVIVVRFHPIKMTSNITRFSLMNLRVNYDLVIYIYIYILYNRLPVLQISMFRSSSQDLDGASGWRRPTKPPGALCIMQSTTTCCTDCVMCPQAHEADSCAPHSFNVSPTRAAVPHRRRFSTTHCLLGRSGPEGSTGLG